MTSSLLEFAYLISAVLFILGLKGMTRPRTAVRGNILGAAGMAVAAVATLFLVRQGVLPEAGAKTVEYVGLRLPMIVVGLLIGGGIGAYVAQKVEMTSMPELVALFNGLGGLASVLVAGAALSLPNAEFDASVRRLIGSQEVHKLSGPDLKAYEQLVASQPSDTAALLATMLSGLIGAVTLSGSLVAFAKLRGFDWLDDLPQVPGETAGNGALFGATLLFGVLFVTTGGPTPLYWPTVILSLALGYSLVIRIGGADMPVVIALLNSYSGLAAAATGFVLSNSVLIVAGTLVGASGLILTQIMCKAMNRSLTNVLFGGIDAGGEGADADEVYATVKSTSAEEVAMLLEDAEKVVIVPGYGMAVAQAQHAVRDLTNTLITRGTEVEFGIHPVAGRMPGHMNVLLAEADIPYDLLLEMDDVNNSIGQADVCLVVGANDTVNPDGRNNPASPIAGMPIIDADKARTTIVIKRSLSPGYAGIPNPLFALPNARMLYGDGRKAVVEIKNALEED